MKKAKEIFNKVFDWFNAVNASPVIHFQFFISMFRWCTLYLILFGFLLYLLSLFT